MDDPDSDGLEFLNRVTQDGSGTVIIWDKIDRLLKSYADPGSKSARAALTRQTKGLEAHLQCVFERFLDFKNETYSNIKIMVNGQSLIPWNPFSPRLRLSLVPHEFRLSVRCKTKSAQLKLFSQSQCARLYRVKGGDESQINAHTEK